jgi:arsenical pump membrane protein
VILAGVALVAAIAAAIGRRVPEAVVAMAGAVVLLLAGVLTWHDAVDEAGKLAPTLVVLASLLVLGDGCERAGLFDALAARMALAARGDGHRLLALVFAAAVVTTAVLGLDATIVLLTPAAFAAAAKARLNSRPHVYACSHLANSASLILPISNLTNLLAFRASGLSFPSFAAKMALPWAIAIAIEWVVLRKAFAQPLEAKGRTPRQTPPEIPKRPLVIVALTLIGFVVAAPLGIDAAWPAAAGALLMIPRPKAVDVPLLAFVLGLGLIVRALNLDINLPHGDGLLPLLATTLIAAALANLHNNVPALLVLLPAAANPATVLAVLIGVNCGPNLTYTGSLATLLWRRILRERDAEPSHKEFHILGALTVPPILIAGTVALWLVT